MSEHNSVPELRQSYLESLVVVRCADSLGEFCSRIKFLVCNDEGQSVGRFTATCVLVSRIDDKLIGSSGLVPIISDANKRYVGLWVRGGLCGSVR